MRYKILCISSCRFYCFSLQQFRQIQKAEQDSLLNKDSVNNAALDRDKVDPVRDSILFL
jgi:hypothetical protein